MKQYDRVVDILRETLKPDCQELMHLPNETTLSRYEQYNLLLTALWESKNYAVRYRFFRILFHLFFRVDYLAQIVESTYRLPNECGGQLCRGEIFCG